MRFFDIFNKQYLKRTLISLASAVLALGIIFYISYHLTNSFDAPLGLQNAVYVDETKIIRADGYILREETVLYASSASEGSVTPAVSDGMRVGRYDKTADIYEGTSPDILGRLEEVESQMELLLKSQSEEVSRVQTAGLDAAIFQDVLEIRHRVEEGALGDAVSMRTSFLVDIMKRNILGGGGADYSSQLSLLQAERNSLLSQLGKCQESCYAPVSGYYYSPDTVDGYERVFDVSALVGMTYDEFMTMIASEPAVPLRSTRCVGKLITDYRWYLACPMTKTEAAELEDGETYRIVFPYNGNKELKMTLEILIPELPGAGAVAVFVCGTIPDGFDYTRMQTVEVCTADYRGFSVPISAVRILDGYEGVYVLDEVTVVFKRIQVVYEGDGYYICTEGDEDPEAEYGWLQMNDVIITEGTGLEAGRVIG